MIIVMQSIDRTSTLQSAVYFLTWSWTH